MCFDIIDTNHETISKGFVTYYEKKKRAETSYLRTQKNGIYETMELKMDKQNIEKDETLTFLRVICAYAVITLHTNGQFWNFSSTEKYWLTANVIESVFYFAVPIFFMITGITLINYQDRYSTKEYFLKRISKTLIPYIAWSFIGVIAMYFMKGNNSITLKYVINGLLNGDIIAVYWFFPALFCIYLSLPLFAAIDKAKRKCLFQYLFVSAFLINVLIPFMKNISGMDIAWPYSVGVISGNMIWIVAGVLLYWYPPEKKIKCFIVCLGVIGLFVHIIGTYKLSMVAGNVVQTYKGYSNLPSILYSMGAFVVLTEIGRKIMKVEILQKVINFLGKYAFAIYLMHWYVMQVLEKILGADTKSIIWRLGAPIIIEIIVIVITYVLRYIPLVKRIVP